MSHLTTLLEKAGKKYNSEVLHFKGGVQYRTFFDPNDEPVLVIKPDNKDLTVLHRTRTSEGDIKIGQLTVDPERVDMYSSLTFLYVIALGTLDHIDTMHKVIAIDTSLGLDPTYPDVLTKADCTIPEARRILESVLLDSKIVNARLIEVGPIIAISIPFHLERVAIRMNWLHKTVSVEYGEYTVARIFSGDMIVSRMLDMVAKMMPELIRLIKVGMPITATHREVCAVVDLFESLSQAISNLNVIESVNTKQ